MLRALSTLVMLLALPSPILILVEAIAAAQFRRWTFAHGLVVLRRSDASVPAEQRLPAEGETDHGKFRRMPDGSLLVRSKWRLGGRGTLFPLRGTVCFSGANAVLEARAPFGPVLFFGPRT